jgi:tripartite-type tricarboxylate transporter receptor subunit TctC
MPRSGSDRTDTVLTRTLSSVLLAGVVAMLTTPASAQTPFYQGKTITVVSGVAPGGSGDIRIKSLLPFLRRYIPGNPTLVVENMPGGGGRKAANHLYNNVRPDGLTMGVLAATVIPLEVLKEDGLMYESSKFIYLGASENPFSYVFLTRKEFGASSLEKLRAASGIRIGGLTVGHTNYVAARLVAYMLDLKEPKFVTGYSGTGDVDGALLRGEIDGLSNGAAAIVRRSPEWLEKRAVDFHTIIDIPKGKKHPAFAQLPAIDNFARSVREARLLAMWRAFRLLGSPFVALPGTPKDRVEILQEAMRKALNDPEFHREYKKVVGEEVEPVMPEQLIKEIRDMPREPEVIDLLKTITGSGLLPPR